MSIESMYNTTASTQRETFVTGSTIKKAYTTKLSSFACHIQPLDPSLTQTLQGVFGKEWLLICAVADFKEGDKVIAGTNEYRITGVETYDFSTNPHCEITMRMFRE
jgi:hypothetical protein